MTIALILFIILCFGTSADFLLIWPFFCSYTIIAAVVKIAHVSVRIRWSVRLVFGTFCERVIKWMTPNDTFFWKRSIKICNQTFLNKNLKDLLQDKKFYFIHARQLAQNNTVHFIFIKNQNFKITQKLFNKLVKIPPIIVYYLLNFRLWLLVVLSEYSSWAYKEMQYMIILCITTFAILY